MTYKFEKKIIDKILNAIKKHQVYLTQAENIPQLGKLGYMYNTLWYAGRVCWGYDGILSKSKRSYQCEDNPKYKIEMCDPQTDEIENLIYDAWNIHVMQSEGKGQPSWNEFKTNVIDGKVYSEVELLGQIRNKTFEDWVNYLTHKDYRYKSLYDSRREVMNTLLAVNGTGYEYKDGYVIMTAGGADQDDTLYAGWENAKFLPAIQKVVDKIMSIPEVEQTVQAAHLYIQGLIDKRKKEDDERYGFNSEDREDRNKKIIDNFMSLTKEEQQDYLKRSPYFISLFRDELIEAGLDIPEVKKPYEKYYPMSKGYCRLFEFDDKVHPSYINAGIEMCEDIIVHQNEEEKSNVNLAKEFLKKYKK